MSAIPDRRAEDQDVQGAISSTQERQANANDGERYLSIGGHTIWAQYHLGPKEPGTENAPSVPTVICFHGSGGSGCRTWLTLADSVKSFAPILLYDRPGSGLSTSPTPNEKGNQKLSSSEELTAILKALDIVPPYILLAHSYGGSLVRDFLQPRRDEVAGIILAETGLETPSKYMDEQNRTQYMRDRPVSVIRANSLLYRLQDFNKALAEGKMGPEQEQSMRLYFDACDKEDERLKKEQLKLSSRTNYVHVPDCGHHIVRDRPDVVVDQVRWVVQQWELFSVQQKGSSKSAAGCLRRLLQKLR